jgi:SRSO17 transposase
VQDDQRERRSGCRVIFLVVTQGSSTAAAAVSIARRTTGSLLEAVAGSFRRPESRRHPPEAVAGLQSQVRTRNCWELAYQAGHRDPWMMQHFFNEAKWDETAVRERVAARVWEHVGDQALRVLAIDETGHVKKGVKTCGVQRQYTGTAGRTENATVTVFAAWVTPDRRFLVDFELYLPQSWANDPIRRDGAGIPPEVGFATKTEQARALLARRIAAGQAPDAVAGDAVYGRSGPLRSDCEAARIAYVLEVGCDKQVRTDPALPPAKVEDLAEAIPTRNWADRSAGAGSRGIRVYSWAYLALDSTGVAGERGLLIRHNRSTGKLAFYLTWHPVRANISALVKIAGLRWPIETTFQDAKGHFGLDEHQMTTWVSIRRWITLCLLAAAAVAIAHLIARASGCRLTLTGLAKLHGDHTRAAHADEHRFAWADWICDHNDQAKRSHYRRRVEHLP